MQGSPVTLPGIGQAARRLIAAAMLAGVACAGDATPAAARATPAPAATATQAPSPAAALEPAVAEIVDNTLAALAAAGDHGLDPADYDAAALQEQWAALRSASTSAADRAMFDLALSVAAARILRAVHNGRVDPTTMHWGYEIERKPVDPHALPARGARGPRALRDARLAPAAICALRPRAQDAG